MKDASIRQMEQTLTTFYGAAGMVSDVELLGTGYEADVYAFSLRPVGGDPPQDLVLRVYLGEGTAAKAAREFDAMDRLHASGYPVPKVTALGRDGTLLGHPFLIMERIRGDSLGPAYWTGTSPRPDNVMACFWKLVADLHRFDAATILPESPLATSQDPYAVIDSELAALSDLLRPLDGREPASLRAAMTWLTERRDAVPCAHVTVVHGDLHANNVLVRADGAAFVIDWSNVRPGDCRTDLAWTRIITQSEIQPDHGAGELRLYERLTGRAVEGIEYFEVIACLRLLLSVLLLLHFGGAGQGLRENRLRSGFDFERSVAGLLEKRTGIPLTDLYALLDSHVV
jgi:aminoglycoside phosphotransferase (APT) family kinase protein